MSFNSWEEVKLSDVTENYNTLRKPLSSKQRLKKQGNYNYYGAQGVIDNIDEYMLEGEYLLIAEDGANLETRNEDIARLTKYDEKFWVNNHAHVLKSNAKSDIRYIKYILNITDLAPYITGSAQPKLNKENLNKIRLNLPPIEEQKAIVKILSDLDDKIEVNNKINKNLEEMAQAIFKHWFVDFEFPNEEGKPYKSSGGEMVDSELGMIPKGWEVKELSEVFTFKKGKKPKEILEKKENEDYKKYLTIDVLNQNSELFALPEKLVECLNDETLMVMDGASSGTIYTGMSGIVGSTLAKLEAKDNSYKTFIFNFLKYREFDIKSHLTGSAIPHADKNYINAIKVALPKEKEVLLNLSNTLRLIMEKIRINKLENKKLNALRDVLLPKLMSGEIRVAFK